MAKRKRLNRCTMMADFYASSPPCKIEVRCWSQYDHPSCLYFVPKTKQPGEDRCKYSHKWLAHCHCPEARVNAAHKIISALRERVIDRKGEVRK